MTPEGTLALICVAGFLASFAGLVWVYWPRSYEPNPRLMAHEERRRWR